MSAFVVGLRDIFVALLPCSIPDLEFESVIFDCDGFDFEVNSDGGNIILFELIVTKSD